jgi:hypothetical protein
MQTARITGPVTPIRATVGGEDIIIGVIVIIIIITAAISGPSVFALCRCRPCRPGKGLHAKCSYRVDRRFHDGVVFARP